MPQPISSSITQKFANFGIIASVKQSELSKLMIRCSVIGLAILATVVTAIVIFNRMKHVQPKSNASNPQDPKELELKNLTEPASAQEPKLKKSIDQKLEELFVLVIPLDQEKFSSKIIDVVTALKKAQIPELKRNKSLHSLDADLLPSSKGGYGESEQAEAYFLSGLIMLLQGYDSLAIVKLQKATKLMPDDARYKKAVEILK